MLKKATAALAAIVLVLGLTNILAGAQEAQPSAPLPSAEAAAGASVYYLNFKPEQARQWEDAARLYTRRTGVPVTAIGETILLFWFVSGFWTDGLMKLFS